VFTDAAEGEITVVTSDAQGFLPVSLLTYSFHRNTFDPMAGARRRGRPRTTWMDNIKTWTALSVEESVRMTEDRDTWRKYVHGVANRRIEDG